MTRRYFRFVNEILSGPGDRRLRSRRHKGDFTYIDDLVEAILRLIACVPETGKRVEAAGLGDTLAPTVPFRIVNLLAVSRSRFSISSIASSNGWAERRSAT